MHILQLYDRRKKLIKKKEKERWDQLDYRYMTEESDASDANDTVYQHKLVWRSEGKGINDFALKLLPKLQALPMDPVLIVLILML